jgi:hypothetical protein
MRFVGRLLAGIDGGAWQIAPASVPADLAAWYLALHSFIMSACASESAADISV